MNRTMPVAVSLLVIAPAAAAQDTVVFDGELAITDDFNSSGNPGGFDLDIDADGTIDVRFSYFGLLVNSIFGWDGVVSGRNGAQVFGSQDDNGRFVLTEFMAGDVISTSSDPLVPGNISGAAGYESFPDDQSGGPLFDQGRGFIGFTWESGLDGGRRFGWAEIEIDNLDDNSFGSLILYRVGWNATSRGPATVGVPAPGTAALLGLGALAACGRRRS